MRFVVHKIEADIELCTLSSSIIRRARFPANMMPRAIFSENATWQTAESGGKAKKFFVNHLGLYRVAHLVADLGWVGLTWISVFHYLTHFPSHFC